MISIYVYCILCENLIWFDTHLFQIITHLQPRLRDKGQKFREVAADLTQLQIPHQEAFPFDIVTVSFM